MTEPARPSQVVPYLEEGGYTAGVISEEELAEMKQKRPHLFSDDKDELKRVGEWLHGKGGHE